ncbi:MAG: hypothetical protein J5950_02125 [Clostridia bacterium]|nr:hypothetical protein [Clostridia bacterium]
MKKIGWMILLAAGLVLIAIVFAVLPFVHWFKSTLPGMLMLFCGEFMLVLSLAAWRISRGKAKSNNLFKALTGTQIVLSVSMLLINIGFAREHMVFITAIGFLGFTAAAVTAFVKLIYHIVVKPNIAAPAPAVKTVPDVQKEERQQTDLKQLIRARVPGDIQNAAVQRRLLDNLSIAFPFVKMVTEDAFELKAIGSGIADPETVIAQLAAKIESALDERELNISRVSFGGLDKNGKIDAYIITDYYVFLLGEKKARKLSSVRDTLLKLMTKEMVQ